MGLGAGLDSRLVFTAVSSLTRTWPSSSPPPHRRDRLCPRDLPRGTTAGQLFRRKGVLTIEGADGAAAAQGAASGAGLAAGEKRFNVNNRLVGADTQLEDGDLVILANHVLKI